MKYDVSGGISRSAGRVFTAFRRALFDLLQHQSFESISVQTLCNAANYPRSTFYNYFDDIYDLLDFCLHAPIRSFDKEKYAAYQPEQRVYAMFSDLYDLLESRRDAFSCVYQNNRPAGVLQSSLIKRLKQEVFTTLTDAAPERPLPREMVAEHCCNVIYLLLSWNSLHDDKLSKDEAMEAVRHLLSGLYTSGEAAGACAT